MSIIEEGALHSLEIPKVENRLRRITICVRVVEGSRIRRIGEVCFPRN